MAAGGGGNNSTGKRKNKKPNNGLHHHHRHRQSLTPELLTLVASATSAAHAFLRQHDLRLLPSQSLSLESNLSSASLSLSKLLSLLHPLSPSLSPPPPPPSPPACWFHRFLSSASAAEWIDAFRMSKHSFSLLLRLLTPSLAPLSPIPPNYALAAALFRLAHGASYSSVARRFGLDSSAACRAFYTVCKSINDKLGHLFELRSDIKRIVVGFGWISLPNCCGVLGHDRFKVDGDILGQNGSLIVQALVDSEGRFLDVSAGWPSTMKPETILRQSEFFTGVEVSGELLNGPCFELSDGNIIPQYILSDSCFPLSPWLLTPFNESHNVNLNSSQEIFNSVHNRGMELVDTAFGRIRVEWQLISKEWKENSIEYFPFVIVTCCLLHNFLIKCSEDLPKENVGYLRVHRDLPVFEGEVDERARRIRDALALHLSRVSQRR